MSDDITSEPGLPEAVLAKIRAARTSARNAPKTGMWCLYGEPGSGRTTTAAMLGDRNLILTCEKGFLSLNNLPDVERRTDILTVEKPGSISQIVTAVNAGQLVSELDGEPYDNIIIDTLTGLYERLVNASFKDPSHANYERRLKGIPSWPDYQWAFVEMRPMILDLFKAKVMVTVLCHPRYPLPDQIAKGETTRPDMGKAVFNLLNEEVAVIGQCMRDSAKAGRHDEFTIRTRGTKSVTAKGWGGWPEIMTQEAFVKAIRSYKES